MKLCVKISVFTGRLFKLEGCDRRKIVVDHLRNKVRLRLKIHF